MYLALLQSMECIGKIPDPIQCEDSQDKLFTVDEQLDFNFTFLWV